MIYIKDSYRHRTEILNIGQVKVIKAIISMSIDVVVYAVYRPTSTCVYEFNDNLQKYLSDTVTGNKCIHLFVGDLNSDITSNDDYCQEYFNILNTAGFNSLINTYTRVQNNSPTCSLGWSTQT